MKRTVLLVALMLVGTGIALATPYLSQPRFPQASCGTGTSYCTCVAVANCQFNADLAYCEVWGHPYDVSYAELEACKQDADDRRDDAWVQCAIQYGLPSHVCTVY